MSFGLPLHDRILKWQLVSRVDSVSPVRGKKSETGGPTSVVSLRTVMKEWRTARPERRGSHHASQSSSCPPSPASSESKCTLPIGSSFLSTYYASRALQTLHAKKIPSIFFPLPKLKILWRRDRRWSCFLPIQGKGKCRMESWEKIPLIGIQRCVHGRFSAKLAWWGNGVSLSSSGDLCWYWLETWKGLEWLIRDSRNWNKVSVTPELGRGGWGHFLDTFWELRDWTHSRWRNVPFLALSAERRQYCWKDILSIMGCRFPLTRSPQKPSMPGLLSFIYKLLIGF